ncbi:MAG: deoxynucleoside kinase [Anaerolineales bacterium]|nr:deoxynucleoside kinase [Anaerolineales bacterium]
MTRRFVLVAGNIGSGKTSLTGQLAARLGYTPAYESVADNPYLADFYGSMAQWSFHLQVFFLGHRAEQHHALAQSAVGAICDRSIFEDYYIFARALHEMGSLADRDFAAYARLFHLVVRHLPPPDLLLYLQASTPTLLGRIRRRGRAMEAGISAEYLDLLNRLYAEWLAAFDLCPVLTIPADDLDFVNHPDHFDLIVSKINDKLAGQDSVVFP